MNKLLAGALLIVTFIGVQSELQAQPFPRARVFSEDDTAKDAECNLSKAPLTAAIEDVLRSKNVQIVPQTSLDAMKVYVSLTAMKVNASSCAVSLGVQFKSYEDLPVPGTTKKYDAEVLYCERWRLLVGPVFDMQMRTVVLAKEVTEMCLTEIRRRTLTF